VSLDQIREEIDAIDEKLIMLLEKRFNLVAKLLPYKKQLSDAQREGEILSKIGPVYVRTLYQEIFRLSKKLLKEAGLNSNNSRL